MDQRDPFKSNSFSSNNPYSLRYGGNEGVESDQEFTREASSKKDKYGPINVSDNARVFVGDSYLHADQFSNKDPMILNQFRGQVRYPSPPPIPKPPICWGNYPDYGDNSNDLFYPGTTSISSTQKELKDQKSDITSKSDYDPNASETYSILHIGDHGARAIGIDGIEIPKSKHPVETTRIVEDGITVKYVTFADGGKEKYVLDKGKWIHNSEYLEDHSLINSRIDDQQTRAISSNKQGQRIKYYLNQAASGSLSSDNQTHSSSRLVTAPSDYSEEIKELLKQKVNLEGRITKYKKAIDEAEADCKVFGKNYRFDKMLDDQEMLSKQKEELALLEDALEDIKKELKAEGYQLKEKR